MMKKFVAMVLVVVMLSTCCVFAENEINYDEIQYIPVRINGGYDIGDTILYRGKTMVPIRRLMYELGGELEYYTASKVIEVQYKDTNVSMKIDSDRMMVTKNGVTKEISGDIIPILISDRVYIPVRALKKMFGFDVYWNNGMVDIIDFNSFWDRIEKEAPLTYNALIKTPKLVSGYFEGEMKTDREYTNTLNSGSSSGIYKISGKYKDGNLNYKLRHKEYYSYGNGNTGYTYENIDTILVNGEIYRKFDQALHDVDYYYPIQDTWIKIDSRYGYSNLLSMSQYKDTIGREQINQKILAAMGSSYFAGISINDFSVLADKLILLEKNNLKQSEKDGKIITEFELNQENLIAFVKAYVKLNGYHSMYLGRYDEICNALDEMGEQFDFRVKGTFESSQDGTITQVLGGNMTYEFKGKGQNQHFSYRMNFTPGEVPDIQAPPAEEVMTEDEAYQRYYENQYCLVTPELTDNTELALRILLPFYDTAEPLIK